MFAACVSFAMESEIDDDKSNPLTATRSYHAMTTAWKPLRNEMTPGVLDDTHECAIVLAVQPDFAAYVDEQRQLFGSVELIARQLDPHITVMYCGYQEPKDLRVRSQFAAQFNAIEVEFHVTQVGAFYNRSGLLTNIHYCIESESLRSLHQTILEEYLALFGRTHTPYVGAQYTPHVSIFDRVAMPKTAISLFARPPERVAWRAGGAHLVGERKTA